VQTSGRVSVEVANVLHYYNNRKNDNFTRKKLSGEVTIFDVKGKSELIYRFGI
jgi:hypothetical protein